jgi:hypothetical protein
MIKKKKKFTLVKKFKRKEKGKKSLPICPLFWDLGDWNTENSSCTFMLTRGLLSACPPFHFN